MYASILYGTSADSHSETKVRGEYLDEWASEYKPTKQKLESKTESEVGSRALACQNINWTLTNKLGDDEDDTNSLPPTVIWVGDSEWTSHLHFNVDYFLPAG